MAVEPRYRPPRSSLVRGGLTVHFLAVEAATHRRLGHGSQHPSLAAWRANSDHHPHRALLALGSTMTIASEHIEIDVDGVARAGDTPAKIAR